MSPGREDCLLGEPLGLGAVDAELGPDEGALPRALGAVGGVADDVRGEFRAAEDVDDVHLGVLGDREEVGVAPHAEELLAVGVHGDHRVPGALEVPRDGVAGLGGAGGAPHDGDGAGRAEVGGEVHGSRGGGGA
jgi:hypothetical protein